MIKAKFVERKNRFTALVDLDGEIKSAHVANSGRLRELFRPGAEVYLAQTDNPHRKTGYDLTLVKYKGKFVSVDARVPNKVVAEAVQNGELEEFRDYRVLKREVKYGDSRLDILLEDKSHYKCFIEVKSVTLVVEGTARFPDAPTQRGTRHISELIRAVGEGNRGAVVFLIQREDASLFSPNDATDPLFGETLRKAEASGVEIYAYTCRVDCREIKIAQRVPVVL